MLKLYTAIRNGTEINVFWSAWGIDGWSSLKEIRSLLGALHFAGQSTKQEELTAFLQRLQEYIDKRDLLNLLTNELAALNCMTEKSTGSYGYVAGDDLGRGLVESEGSLFHDHKAGSGWRDYAFASSAVIGAAGLRRATWKTQAECNAALRMIRGKVQEKIERLRVETASYEVRR